MSRKNNELQLPNYDDFIEALEVLSLSVSGSELHGTMCGYLCAGADNQGEAYLKALLNNKKDKASRKALASLFSVYTISQQQIAAFDFQFEILIPDDNASLVDRARGFCDWCEGFSLGLAMAGVDVENIHDEEAQDAIFHINEFAKLDIDGLEVNEEDERNLMEVSEYTRMAVLKLHSELVHADPRMKAPKSMH